MVSLRAPPWTKRFVGVEGSKRGRHAATNMKYNFLIAVHKMRYM